RAPEREVVRRCGPWLRRLSTVILVAEHHHALHEIADDGDELVVVLVLEILPRELAVLLLRYDARQAIAQLILPVRPTLDVLVQPHRPVAAGADLPSLEVEELVRRHVLRKHVAA